MSFTDWPWRHWRTRRADKPALRLDDVTLSWSQMGERIDRGSRFSVSGRC